MSAAIRIPIDQAKIADFCRRHHIRKLSLFGSVLRDDFGPESDVDVLVEPEPGALPGLAFFEAAHELEELLGRRVDFLLPTELSPYYRESVVREAEAIYVTS